MTSRAGDHRPRLGARAHAWLLPMAVAGLGGYAGAALWSARISVTSSRSLPVGDYVGFAQYTRLLHSVRWQESAGHLVVYGLIFVVAALVIGTLLAVLVDHQAEREGVLRSVFLYPYALSSIATGLIWQWLFNPELGLRVAHVDWLGDPDMVLWALAIASLWQSAGFVMTLLLAGLRTTDPAIRMAAAIDGVPLWRLYAGLLLPSLVPFYATAGLLLLSAVARLYDLVVAMTQGGPGGASEVPAKFIMDHLFGRANLAQACAASTCLLLSLAVLMAPLWYLRARRAGAPGRA